MKLKRRYSLLVGFFLTSSLLLSACGSSGPSSSETNESGTNNTKENSVEKQEKVVLDLWWSMSANNEEHKNHYAAIEKFNQEHPNIEVKPQSIPLEQAKDKIITSANAGNPPDVADVLNEWLVSYHRMGILPDLTEDINKWEEKEKIPQNIWDTLSVDGKIVAVPSELGIRAFLYHEDMLKAAGAAEPPKTWDELLELSAKLKGQGVAPFGISGQSARAPQELIVYFWQSGTDIAHQMPDGKYRNLWAENPEELQKAVEVYELYKTMLKDGVINKDSASWGYRELDTNFAQGRVATTVNGPWIKNYEAEQPESMKDVQIAAPPYNTVPATFMEVGSFATFEGSEHKKEAITFMTWWLSEETQKLVNPGRSPNTGVVQDGKWGEGFYKLLDQGRSFPGISMGGIIQPMIDSIQKSLLTEESPEEIALWLGEQINNSLKENGELSESPAK